LSEDIDALMLLIHGVYAVQMERKIIALKDELVQVQEQEQSIAARAIQAAVCVLSY